MPESTFENDLQLGLQYHNAGRLSDAEAVYRRVVSRQPENAQAIYLLGTVAGQTGRWRDAESLLTRAIALDPAQALYYNNLGIVLKRQGRLDEAIAAYRKAIERQRDYPEALSNLGNLLAATGALDEAETCCRAATRLRPDYAEAHYNLGLALFFSQRHEDAIAAFGRALELQPQLAEAWYRMGMAKRAAGRVDEAYASFQHAIRLRPNLAEAHLELGVVQELRGKHQAAVDSYRQALRLRPSFPEALNNLGNALKSLGKLEEAADAYRAALRTNPAFVEALYNLANLLAAQGKVEEAIARYREVIQLKPDFAPVYNNFGGLLKELGRLDEALPHFEEALRLDPRSAAAMNNIGVVLFARQCFVEAADMCRRALAVDPHHVEALANLSAALNMLRQTEPAIQAARAAIALQPAHAGAHNNLSFALRDQGALDEAMAECRTSVTLKADPKVHGNLLYMMHFHQAFDAAALYKEHLPWNEAYARPLEKLSAPHRNDPAPGRRIRIGYVSPDFRSHPIGRFMLGPLANHHKDNVEVFLYSDVIRPDEATARIQNMGHHWRNIVGLSDQQAADLIRADQIDILIELTMHMTGNRLLALARKPAPVQATYLAYPSTTGLTAIDYRISDIYLDPLPPPGVDLPRIYSEETVYSPGGFWCYDLLGTEAEVNELPALGGGQVTFGCLNNFCKVNDDVVRTWGRVVRGVPKSRMIIQCSEGATRERTLQIFRSEGVEASRIEFKGLVSSHAYFQLYHRIDIALDTFPCNGHTTSMDGCWMGVPVITMVGPTNMGRGGLDLLSNLKLPELIARSGDEFVRAAVDLAEDTQRLRGLRTTLRERMHSSPLMDAVRFSEGLESLYRELWRRWCATR